ncbi:MAG: sodium-translocating pyrophosphatase [Candidatus Ranarchaeia archaeon]
MGFFHTFVQLTLLEQISIMVVIVAAIVSLIYALWLRDSVLKKDKGTEEMQDVWNGIREGADAYLKRQLRSIIPIIGVLTVLLFFSVYIIPPTAEAVEAFFDYNFEQIKLIIATGRAIAFLMGAFFSLIVGQLGMRMAIQSSIRVTSAAGRSYKEALTIAYHGGTYTGMLTDGLGLLGGTVIFIIFGVAAPDALLGFGFGGTLLALFMRVGGGIYTKAADVGADLVGKVEHDIPEDDPRNAAVIADLVGDNVGDCAGMAADIFESYEVTIVSTLILGLVLYALTNQFYWIVFPLVVRAIGVLSSIIGTFTVSYWENVNAEEAMFRSYEVSSIFTIIVSGLLSYFYTGDIRLGILIAIGVGLAVSFNPLTSYFTSKDKPPVQEIVEQTKTGPATTILSGLSVGYESSVWALVVIVIAFLAAYWLAIPTPGSEYYFISLIGIGMLSHTGNNVAMDSYGPISDNAGGIGELVGIKGKSKEILAELDAVGNTTKAITKGVAIASAVIAAVSLFASFYIDVGRVSEGLGITNPLLDGIRINLPLVFSGLLLGAALPWLFSALSIRAVSRAAGDVVEEVRGQFKIPGILEGTKKPDYEKVVSISTKAAQKELFPLAIIAVATPLLVGLLLQVEALAGFLAGIIVSGQLLAVYMSNAGGAWDNAKKAIEDEPRNLKENTGKGSERHKAGIVGDTVGDPLKDTAGPALNPMIKVCNLVSLLVAPILVQYNVYSENVAPLTYVIFGVSVFVLLILNIWAFRTSKRKI